MTFRQGTTPTVLRFGFTILSILSVWAVLTRVCGSAGGQPFPAETNTIVAFTTGSVFVSMDGVNWSQIQANVIRFDASPTNTIPTNAPAPKLVSPKAGAQ